MSLLVGLPAPCPAFVSISINTGCGPACAAWSVAVNLKECPGTTRSSGSAEAGSTAGRRGAGPRLGGGRYLESTGKWDAGDAEPEASTHGPPIVGRWNRRTTQT